MVNKVVLITGSSRGIGFELINQFINDNYTVVAISRESSKYKKNIKKKNFLYCKCDLSKIEDLKLISGFLLKNKIDYIDILINNAGSMLNTSIENTSYERAMNVFRVNFFAAAFLVKELLPFLESKSKLSHVVNITSMGGFQGSQKYTGLAFYSASKAALAVFTECIAEELKDRNIRCNALALGSVQTEMLSTAFPGYKAPVNAHEIASFIKYFSINLHMYFNGKIIPISSSTP